MNTYVDSFEMAQANSFVLVYEYDNQNFDVNGLNDSFKQQGCSYVTLDVYHSRFLYEPGCRLDKILISNKHYYYFHLVFSSRQKLQQDAVTKNVTLPRYYRYNEECFPKILEKAPTFSDKDGVLFMLRLATDQNNAKLLAHFESSTTGLSKTNLQYHYWQILKLDTSQNFDAYVKEHNLHYFLDTLFSKYKALKQYNNVMSSLGNGIELYEIPDFLNSYLQVSRDFESKSPIITPTVEQQVPDNTLSVINEPILSDISLEGLEEQVIQSLETTDYNLDIGIRIFNSINVQSSPILDKIVKQKHEKTNDLKKEPPGYRFLFYEKNLETVLPYRTKSPNKGLVSIFLYFSKDYKEKYLKYLPEDQKKQYLND